MTPESNPGSKGDPSSSDPTHTHRALSRLTAFPFQTIFVEVISIVLGVLLALAVNQWRETSAREKHAEQALAQIHEEVLSNQELLRTIYANNKETLDRLHESDETGEDDDRSFIPGIQVNSTAWETANSIGVFTHIDYDEIVALSRLYSIQKIYKEYGTSLIESLMTGTAVAAANGRPWNESEAIKTFESSLSLLVQLEESLLQMYTDVVGDATFLPGD